MWPFRQRAQEKRTGEVSDLSNPRDWLLKLLGLYRASHTGVVVNSTTALYSSAVLGSVKILAESISSLPLNVYKRLPNGGKEKATDHPLYPILHLSPNSEMTSLELRETLEGHLALRGNAYAEKEINGAGRVMGLWPLHPDKVIVKRQSEEPKKLYYIITLPNGQQAVLTADRIMHLRTLSTNGIVGLSPLELARESIGLSLALEEYDARFFANNANPGGVLQTTDSLSDKALKNLKESWEKRHEGLDKAHRLAILEEGLTWQQVGISQKDSQFLESRKFQVTEICRIFRIPPHMVADLERATFNNIEEMSLEFVIYCLMPWLVRWEQRMMLDLLSPNERNTYFIEHLVAGLLRGDIQKRYTAYATARQWGWMSADDIRELENQNPLPDGQGKIYMMPLNMIIAPKAGEEPAKPEEKTKLHITRITDSYKPLFMEAIRRIIKREEADVMRAAKKTSNKNDIQALRNWIDEFYKEHPEYIRKQILPVFSSYGQILSESIAESISFKNDIKPDIEKAVSEYEEKFNKEFIETSHNQLKEILSKTDKTEDVIAELQKRFTEWYHERAVETSSLETSQQCNFISERIYKLAGRDIKDANIL